MFKFPDNGDREDITPNGMEFKKGTFSATALLEKQTGKRRKHKNSKNGCPNCKKRRVKCSEDLPACMNCIKHKVRCGYLDYTEEQLNELKEAKLSASADEKGQDDQAFVSDQVAGSTQNQPETHVSISALGTSVSDTDFPEGRRKSSLGETHVNTFGMGVNNVLNFQSNLITKDFDNLLSTSGDGENPIIYPVYAINHSEQDFSMVPSASVANSNPLSPHAMNPNPNFIPSRDVFNSGAFPTDKDGAQLNAWSHFSTPGEDVMGIERTLDPDEGNCFPGAVASAEAFDIIYKPAIDYNQLLLKKVISLGPSISAGTCPLEQIRELYANWLNSFIFTSFSSEMMFSCLLNLTTNYLISNCFKPEHSNFADLIDKTRATNILIVSSIKHYAIVIKELRHFLNSDDNDKSSSASYILSLTSIYDPAATLNSSICFRDGLFSVLSHGLAVSRRLGQRPSIITLSHLKLMVNVIRSVYLEGYDPTFLEEFRTMLKRFGAILRGYNELYDVSNLDAKGIETVKFVHKKYNDLLSFANDAIDSFIPTVNNNLGNLDIQQQCLFDMCYKWVRLFPVRLMVITAKSDPLEKVLYLFYKVFKKALFAILPQIKFFFLRDFDSPLMIDVFVTTNDQDVYNHELDNPINCCYPRDIYHQYSGQLKYLSGYTIRIITFLQKRLNILYKTIVHDQGDKKLFPVDDARKWRKSIVDIAQARQEFREKSKLSEVPITSFSTTIIKPYHYPTTDDEKTHSSISLDDRTDNLELMSLGPNGLLLDDYDISS
ncbi:Piso0_001355 [Millerozyma farinosa CBS 7064]|uniref:Piso0_001355 protein n=1 Tax=Pichia sorbitophila (strain ATCC MYA-4447 / BCRC 22081 / CBS 7064 / NBRC 10061 / NRRL Y-12695) TaxID=559304 RepID=G8YMJ0_PICSO|nr:Piso0_001355 [Millerozyma farinosa CBS 7064]